MKQASAVQVHHDSWVWIYLSNGDRVLTRQDSDWFTHLNAQLRKDYAAR